MGLAVEGANGYSLSPEECHLMEQSGTCWTIVHDGDPIACGGFIQMWPGRHVAWMLLDDRSRRHMGYVTRQALKKLAGIHGRIELTVRADFYAGLRWAEMLGFKIEAPLMRRFGPDGADHVGYVRVNGD